MFCSLSSGGAPSSFRHDYGPELDPEEAEERMEVRLFDVDVRDKREKACLACTSLYCGRRVVCGW